MKPGAGATSAQVRYRHVGVAHAWLSLGFLIGTELLTAEFHAGLGLAVHAGLLVLFLLRSCVTTGRESNFYIALALLPLLRILSLTMPPQLVSQATQLVLVHLPLVLATLIAASVLGYGRKEPRRYPYIPFQLLIAATGPLIGYLVYAIVQPPALAESLEPSYSLWPAATLFFAAFSEELIFRGVLLTAATRFMGPGQGIALSALAYGAFHMGWQPWLLVGFLTLLGLSFSHLAYLTRSLLGVTLAQGLANVIVFIVLPLLETG